MQVQWRGLFRFFLPNIRCVSVPYIGGFVLTLPLHYQILIIKSLSLIQLKNEIVLTFVV